jgi:hypothetical protein
LGLVCKVHVTAADISDRDGAVGLLRRLDWRRFPRLRHGWVDQGYRGQATTNEIARFRPLLDRLDLADTLITADALSRSRHNASYAEVVVMPRWGVVGEGVRVSVPGRSA